MTPADLLKLFRDKTQDTATPPLWEDVEFYEYLDDAQKESCRRAHLLIDSTSDVAEGAITAGDPMVEISQKIIHIRRARLGSNGMPLRRMSVRDMDQQYPGWEASTSQSVPMAYIPDYETGYLRLFPTPNATNTVKMTVVREPSGDITDEGSTIEIPSRYHRSLLDWVLFRAYSKADPETQDDDKAKKHEALFINEFGEKSSAVDERWAFEQYQDMGET